VPSWKAAKCELRDVIYTLLPPLFDPPKLP
jgi:hypothetical protein